MRTDREVLDDWKGDAPDREWKVEPSVMASCACLLGTRGIAHNVFYGDTEAEAMKKMADMLRDQEHGA